MLEIPPRHGGWRASRHSTSAPTSTSATFAGPGIRSGAQCSQWLASYATPGVCCWPSLHRSGTM
eukprot:55951-Alexandrium_andersonii.AAC.1